MAAEATKGFLSLFVQGGHGVVCLTPRFKFLMSGIHTVSGLLRLGRWNSARMGVAAWQEYIHSIFCQQKIVSDMLPHPVQG